MDQFSTPTTTADSSKDGRLIVGVGSPKKCLKCAIKKTKHDGAGGCGHKKHDGKGGSGLPAPVSYGASNIKTPSAFNGLAASMTSKPHRAGAVSGGLKIKGIKKLKKFSSASSGKMKFGKALVGSTKSSSLKGVLKSLI